MNALSVPASIYNRNIASPETATAAGRELSIPSALGRVENLIERLVKSGITLNDRLLPVSRPLPPVPASPTNGSMAPIPTSGTTMSDHLHRLADRLESVECGLNDLASRLEI